MIIIGDFPLLLVGAYIILKMIEQHKNAKAKWAKGVCYFGLGLAIVISNFPDFLYETKITTDIIISMYVAAMCFIESIDLYVEYQEQKFKKSNHLIIEIKSVRK